MRIVAEDEGSGFVMSEELELESSRDVVLVLSAVPDLSGVVRDGRGAGIAGAIVKLWGSQLGIPPHRDHRRRRALPDSSHAAGGRHVERLGARIPVSIEAPRAH